MRPDANYVILQLNRKKSKAAADFTEKRNGDFTDAIRVRSVPFFRATPRLLLFCFFAKASIGQILVIPLAKVHGLFGVLPQLEIQHLDDDREAPSRNRCSPSARARRTPRRSGSCR